MKGEVASYILKDDIAKAQKAVQDYIQIFGKDNFYLELQDHGLDEQKDQLLAEKLCPGLFSRPCSQQ